MKITLRSLLQLTGVVAVMFFLTGCALTTDSISLSYVSQANASHIAGAEGVTVAVAVSDQRDAKDCVGHKINGYGQQMAPIVALNDVPGLVKSAIETELQNRGFNLGAARAVSVRVSLNKFSNQFQQHFFSGDAVAEVTMSVAVNKPDGSPAYLNMISGQGTQPNIQMAGGENARVALDAALQDAMRKLFDDSAFMAALIASGKTAAAAEVATPAPVQNPQPSPANGAVQISVPPGPTTDIHGNSSYTLLPTTASTNSAAPPGR